MTSEQDRDSNVQKVLLIDGGPSGSSMVTLRHLRRVVGDRWKLAVVLFLISAAPALWFESRTLAPVGQRVRIVLPSFQSSSGVRQPLVDGTLYVKQIQEYLIPSLARKLQIAQPSRGWASATSSEGMVFLSVSDDSLDGSKTEVLRLAVNEIETDLNRNTDSFLSTTSVEIEELSSLIETLRAAHDVDLGSSLDGLATLAGRLVDCKARADSLERGSVALDLEVGPRNSRLGTSAVASVVAISASFSVLLALAIDLVVRFFRLDPAEI